MQNNAVKPGTPAPGGMGGPWGDRGGRPKPCFQVAMLALGSAERAACENYSSTAVLAAFAGVTTAPTIVSVCETAGWGGDGGRALNRLCAALRRRFDVPYVGLLGSQSYRGGVSADLRRGGVSPRSGTAFIYNPLAIEVESWGGGHEPARSVGHNLAICWISSGYAALTRGDVRFGVVADNWALHQSTPRRLRARRLARHEAVPDKAGGTDSGRRGDALPMLLLGAVRPPGPGCTGRTTDVHSATAIADLVAAGFSAFFCPGRPGVPFLINQAWATRGGLLPGTHTVHTSSSEDRGPTGELGNSLVTAKFSLAAEPYDQQPAGFADSAPAAAT